MLFYLQIFQIIHLFIWDIKIDVCTRVLLILNFYRFKFSAQTRGSAFWRNRLFQICPVAPVRFVSQNLMNALFLLWYLKIRTRWFYNFPPRPTPAITLHWLKSLLCVTWEQDAITIAHLFTNGCTIDRRILFTYECEHDGHLVYMEISNWHAPVSRWYTIRLRGGKKPFYGDVVGEWWMVKKRVNTRKQKCNGRLD